MIQLQIGNMVIFGIDSNNLKLLKENMPMVIDSTQFKPFTKIVIMYGDTIHDVKREIEKQTGLKLPNGVDVAPNERKDVTDLANSMNQVKH